MQPHSLASFCACLVIQFRAVMVNLILGSLEHGLLDLIPVTSCLRAVWLDGFVRIDNSWLKYRCLFIVIVYTLTYWSSPETKDQFYRHLSRLLRKWKYAVILIILFVACWSFSTKFVELSLFTYGEAYWENLHSVGLLLSFCGSVISENIYHTVSKVHFFVRVNR